MLFAKLALPETYVHFLRHPFWEKALNWIRQMPASLPPGIYPLISDQMFANVHGYATKVREECRYESHRTYIDLQYCIRGGELIEWHPRDDLQPKDEYDPKNDVIHHHPPGAPGGLLRMTPGSLAIFFPPDAHMPKLADGVNPNVHKLVVKAAIALFQTDCLDAARQ